MPLPSWSPEANSLEAVYANSSTGLRILLVILTVGLSPIAEELFHRGWLWTALRNFWAPIPVMVATGLPWLAIHLLDDIRAPIAIFFVGIILSLARHFRGSVRASMALHLLNNLAAIAMTASLYALR